MEQPTTESQASASDTVGGGQLDKDCNGGNDSEKAQNKSTLPLRQSSKAQCTRDQRSANKLASQLAIVLLSAEMEASMVWISSLLRSDVAPQLLFVVVMLGFEIATYLTYIVLFKLVSNWGHSSIERVPTEYQDTEILTEYLLDLNIFGFLPLRIWQTQRVEKLTKTRWTEYRVWHPHPIAVKILHTLGLVIQVSILLKVYLASGWLCALGKVPSWVTALFWILLMMKFAFWLRNTILDAPEQVRHNKTNNTQSH